MSEAMIQADGLVKIYKTKQTEVLALQGLDLTVETGELTALIGNSGSGKSTFLRILCGELEPTRGDISIPSDTRMSVLKQNHFEFEDYTGLDTVIMGNERLYSIMKEKEALEAAMEELEMTWLEKNELLEAENAAL